ncbi:MAG: LytTR family DNA-binding domain-containing protein [Pseudomonadota bacterium]
MGLANGHMGLAGRVFSARPIQMTVIFIAQAAVLAVMGVYDSNEMPILWRFVFWFVLMSVGGIAFSLTEPLVRDRWFKDANLAVHIGIISLIVSVPITIGLMGLNTRLAWDRPLSVWAMQFVSVMIIAVIFIGGTIFARRLFAKETSASRVPGSAFLERLPVKLRSSTLWAINSEGHYLRVFTDRGETLILLRLSDALRELEGVSGLQTHRSWWVAEQGIEQIKTSSGKKTILLKSGQEVPVARSRLSSLKQVGWR